MCSHRPREDFCGQREQYTIVIWLEGEAPECVDDIIGGSVQFLHNIQARAHRDHPVPQVDPDIIDTLRGTDPSPPPAQTPGLLPPQEYHWETGGISTALSSALRRSRGMNVRSPGDTWLRMRGAIPKIHNSFTKANARVTLK